MGLDSFWKLPEGAEPPEFNRPLHICGCMLSENGEGSFRGKVYADLLQYVTGENIYTAEISNDVVKKMAGDLDNTNYEKAFRHTDLKNYGYAISREEYADLVYMFNQYAKAGAILQGWW